MVKPPDIAATLAAIKSSLSPSADTDAETHAREFPSAPASTAPGSVSKNATAAASAG